MVLQLNPERVGHQEFYGRNVDQMPALLKDNRVPMSTAYLMQRRLDPRNPPEVKTAWMDNYFDTSDLKAQRGNEVKLFLTTYADGSITPLGREYLAMINPTEELINGAVNLGVNGRYEKIQGNEVIVTSREKLAKVIDEQLTEQQANDSELWRVLLRHPDAVPKVFAIPGLHEEAIPYIFAEGKQRFNYNRMMGVYPGSVNEDVSELRAWFVGRLDYGSGADGGGGLGSGRGRLVGLAPEALGVPGKSALEVKAYTTADVQDARKELSALTQVRPELFEKTSTLLAKL